MGLPLSLAVDYISHSFEQEKEQYAWELWKSMYPNMVSGQQKFIKFENFKSELFNKNYKYTEKTSEEIMKEFAEVIGKHEAR